MHWEVKTFDIQEIAYRMCLLIVHEKFARYIEFCIMNDTYNVKYGGQYLKDCSVGAVITMSIDLAFLCTWIKQHCTQVFLVEMTTVTIFTKLV